MFLGLYFSIYVFPDTPASGHDVASLEDIVIETCSYLDFNATCPTGTLILVTSAYFGRMHELELCRVTLGEEVGCATDVTGYMDRLCGLRQTCDVDIGAEIVAKLGANSQCGDLTSFLQVTFSCIQGQLLKSISITGRVKALEGGEEWKGVFKR